MKDGIIKADGTSRRVKATFPATYEEFRAQAAAGTLSLDVLFQAAGWSQQPTFLNKAALLQDNTAALYRLNGSAAVPNDILNFLGQYNLHWWRRKSASKSISIDSTPHTVVMFSLQTFSDSVTINYSTSLTINSDDSVSLSNPQTITVTGNDYGAVSVLAGKYFEDEEAVIYKASDTISTTRTNSGGSWYHFNLLYGYVPVVVQAGEWALVSSANRNAYPDSGTSGSYEYEYLGVPLENAKEAIKLETGSYTGTGTSGSSNPNSLTFSFTPKIVFVINSQYYKYGTLGVLIPNSLMGQVMGISTHDGDPHFYPLRLSLSEKTISWYSDDGSFEQMNSASASYAFVAIGYGGETA